MTSFVPDFNGFIIINENCINKWLTIFKVYNCLSDEESLKYDLENKQMIKDFIQKRGSELENLLSFEFTQQTNTTLLTNQLNFMRKMKKKNILNMKDIFEFLEAIFVLNNTKKGKSIMTKWKNHVSVFDTSKK